MQSGVKGVGQEALADPGGTCPAFSLTQAKACAPGFTGLPFDHSRFCVTTLYECHTIKATSSSFNPGCCHVGD